MFLKVFLGLVYNTQSSKYSAHSFYKFYSSILPFWLCCWTAKLVNLKDWFIYYSCKIMCLFSSGLALGSLWAHSGLVLDYFISNEAIHVVSYFGTLRPEHFFSLISSWLYKSYQLHFHWSYYYFSLLSPIHTQALERVEWDIYSPCSVPFFFAIIMLVTENSIRWYHT